MSFLRLTHGQVTSRDLVITAAATLAVAAAMVAAFAVLGGRSGQQGSDDEAAELINQIKQLSAQEEAQHAPGAGVADTAEKDGGSENETTISGALTAINGKTLTILDDGTAVLAQVLLTDRTVATYNGNAFDQTDFYVGDLLSVRAAKNKGAWEAAAVTVRFAASAQTGAPVPQKLQERPDGTLQPLGNQ
ncbi:MAG: hypothetical protein HYS45_00020 [Parcubacteria group bacterium]|nr:hypothetical protein [Parcubacteria group bacterium]